MVSARKRSSRRGRGDWVGWGELQACPGAQRQHEGPVSWYREADSIQGVEGILGQLNESSEHRAGFGWCVNTLGGQ